MKCNISKEQEQRSHRVGLGDVITQQVIPNLASSPQKAASNDVNVNTQQQVPAQNVNNHKINKSLSNNPPKIVKRDEYPSRILKYNEP